MSLLHTVIIVFTITIICSEAKTKILIQGLEGRNDIDVLILIGERLTHIRNKPANHWRAEDAAFLVKQLLKNDGYTQAEVTPSISSTHQIILNVNEGQRLTLGKVAIVGDEDAKKLSKLFTYPARKNSPLGIQSTPYREQDSDLGLSYIVQQLQSEGFWEAQVTLHEKNLDPKTGKMNLLISVKRGDRFTIANPSVTSSDGRGVKRAAATWQSYVGRWANTQEINALRLEMEEAFMSRGYPDAHIQMNSQLGKKTWQPYFTIELGERVKLSQIQVEGLVKTKSKRIDTILQTLKTEWYDKAAMKQTISRLLATGAFDSIRLKTKEVATKQIDATLNFSEAKAKEISVAVGAGSFYGPLIRSTYLDRNVKGSLKSFSTGLEFSGLGILGELKLVDPWWLGSHATQAWRLFSLSKDFDGYRIFETGLETGWKWEASKRRRLELLLSYSVTDVTDSSISPLLLGDTHYSHLKLSFRHSWDHRDNPVLPKEGWHFSTPISLGLTVSDHEESYAKIGMEGGYFRKIGKNYNLGIGGTATWIHTQSDILNLPVDLRVFNGGVRGVRSFPERELSPFSNGHPYGGEMSWVVNTELSRQLGGSLSAIAFTDIGQVKGNYTAEREAGLEAAIGLGLRFDLPVGPVRLEYGHSLSNDKGEPSGAWHFAMGTTF